MDITTQIINAIKSAKNILVCGHIRPDGDCVSSALAVRRLCEKLGKNADAVCDTEKIGVLKFLPDYGYFCEPRFKSYDLFIAVDCATDKRLGEYQKQFNAARTTINIDHHPTNSKYAQLNYIVPEECSTCAILYKLFAPLGIIDKETATMLYTGISTDTGHFMHSNTTPEVFRIAGELCKYGVDISAVNHDIYCDKSLNKLKLTAKAIENIRLYEDGKIALMMVTLADLDSCGCVSADTEGLIDYASSISGVKISIAMCEQTGALYRVSFRSVSADVAAAAGTFGGGGHKLAAGCIVNGNRFDVTEKVLAAAKTALYKKA